jgi:hypothetical protein
VVNSDIEKFLDELEDSHLDPHLRAILDETDSHVRADDYRRFLEYNFRKLYEGIYIENSYNFFEGLMNKEMSRRAREWNSKLTQCNSTDYIFPEKEGFRDSESA